MKNQPIEDSDVVPLNDGDRSGRCEPCPQYYYHLSENDVPLALCLRRSRFLDRRPHDGLVPYMIFRMLA